MAVLDVTPQGLRLVEIAEGLSLDDVRQATAARFSADPDLKTIQD